jgi:hypothetical protein
MKVVAERARAFDRGYALTMHDKGSYRTVGIVFTNRGDADYLAGALQRRLRARQAAKTRTKKRCV